MSLVVFVVFDLDVCGVCSDVRCKLRPRTIHGRYVQESLLVLVLLTSIVLLLRGVVRSQTLIDGASLLVYLLDKLHWLYRCVLVWIWPQLCRT